jgi:TRAP-type C4-dicarboxylate transport system permease small subunit
LSLAGPAAATGAADLPSDRPAALGGAARLLGHVNRVVSWLAATAVVLAACTLTYEVVIRYFYRLPTDWQDEVSVFLLVGATFLSASYVQERRGHVAIEAVGGLLPPRVERMRGWLADAASLAFCSFFAWKSWTLLWEAWDEGQVSSSSWAPPLWIPYSTMALGMTLLCLQLLLQVLSRRHLPTPLPDRPLPARGHA